jgi:hypothetical protein
MYNANKERMLNILSKYNDMYLALNAKTNQARITKDVMTRLKLFMISDRPIDEQHEQDIMDDEQGEEGVVKLPIHNIGGFGSMSKEMKQYMGFTSSFVDLHGLGVTNADELSQYGIMNETPFNLASDAFTIYNGLDRALSGVRREDMLARMHYYAQANTNVASFKNKLFNDIKTEIFNHFIGLRDNIKQGLERGAYDNEQAMEEYMASLEEKAKMYYALDDEALTQLSTDVLKLSPFYDKFISTFRKDTNKFFLSLYSTSNGVVKTLASNQKDVHHIQMQEWSKNYRSLPYDAQEKNRMMADAIEALDYIMKGNDLINGISDPLYPELDSISIEEACDKIAKKLATVGINVSPQYIKFSYLHNNTEILTDRRQSGSVHDIPYYDSLQRFLDNYNVEGMQVIDNEWYDGVMSAIAEAEKHTTDSGIFVEITAGEGAKGRLQALAASNAFFDESVGKSTFTNIEGETVYDKVLPYYYSEEVMELRNKARRAFMDMYVSGDVDAARDSLRAALKADGVYRTEYLFEEYFKRQIERT